METKRGAWWLGLLWLAGWGLAAQAAPGPQELIQETTDRMIATLQESKAAIEKNPAEVYRLVEEIALPHFDFDRISSWVLAKYWRGATPVQRERFKAEFIRLLVRTYATALTEYEGQQIKLLPVRMKPGDTDVKVRSEVEQPGAFPIPIDYRLYLKNGEWKIYDVAIDDISLVANYRTTFATEIRTGGLDKLIETLTARNNGDARP